MTDVQKLECIYRDYFKRIYNYVYYRTLNKEITEDIVSETFLRVVDKLDHYDCRKGALSSWIYTICKHCLTDYYRKNPSQVPIEACADRGELDGELARIENEAERMLFCALALLDERERTLFYYKYYLGETNRAIAQHMDISESTVGTIVFRAHRKIRQQMDFDFE